MLFRSSFLFLFGINNGLRMSDIIGLKVGDIRGKSKPIIVEHKTGKQIGRASCRERV